MAENKENQCSPNCWCKKEKSDEYLYAQFMPKITYKDNSGNSQTIEVENGLSVMEGAIQRDIPGIDADCGGSCSCATCHVYVDDSFRDLVGPPNENEEQMLEFAEEVRPESRLSCQIKISDDLDGLIVTPA